MPEPQPIIKDTWMKNKCKQIVCCCDKLFIKYILGPIFVQFIPALLTVVAVKGGLHDEVIDLFGKDTGTFFKESALLIIIGCFLYITVIKAIYEAIKKHAKPTEQLGADHLLALINAIEVVVVGKTKRMSDHLKDTLNTKVICGKQTFVTITRPDQQIALLVESIKTVFEYMDKQQTTFRIGLLRIEKDKPVAWEAFSPLSVPPRTDAAALKSPTSTVSNCIKTKSIVIIDDIKKELSKKTKKQRRFMKGNVQEEEKGSQLCYPLIHPATGNIEYVLTLSGSTTRCLITKNAEIYVWIIKHFAVRLSMEHCLLIMKGKVNESESTQEHAT